MSQRKHLHFFKNPKRISSFGSRMKFVFACCLPVCLLLSCTEAPRQYDAQVLVDEAIAKHGDLKNKEVSFVFRDRKYSVTRSASEYTYVRSWEDDSLGSVMDILVNSSEFIRMVNRELVHVDTAWVRKYSESVNSVLYFFQLPYVLNDASAKKKYVGEFSIKGEPYLAVQVTFSEEGGGSDYQDVFLYWIHAQHKTLDFLAYQYFTEGGGVRFREAINRREIKGLLIQDYVNHKAPVGTPLEKLPELFESGQLENLSLIINEDVRVMPIK